MILFAAALAMLAVVVPVREALALEIEFSGRLVKRDILALYDGRRERRPHETRIHKFAEMPLNYLGYRLTYHDVNTPLPEPSNLARYRGVLSWFVEPLRRPEAVVEWLDKVTERGLKLVILGDVAPPGQDWLLPAINRVTSRLGLENTGEYIDLTWRSIVTERNPEMVGFERPVDKALPGYPVIRASGGDTVRHVVVESPGPNGTRVASTLVATSPAGGFASQDYTVFFEPNTDRLRWTLNPFAFFKQAFGAERFPAPDVTTLAGRRLYFSHIDGDGWNNLSEIEGYREAQRLSADVIAREAIIPYPDLPVTVGLIAGDVNLDLGGNPAGAAVARQMFALPHVEVASHTYTHPYDWQFFEVYERSAEVAKIAAYQPPDLTARERLTRGVMSLANKSVPADRHDRYVAGSDELPRTYMRKPFDLDVEVGEALKMSESLAPKGKPARMYLWSGDTTPFADAIKAVRLAGARNINGGDSRLDREFPSVAYVPPISRIAGDERQIYAANSNENTYTNDWTGPYYGYFMLEHTLANTELPRRLKPFNLYYHMYSGEKTSALASVRHFLDMARNSRVIPVATSDYAGIAESFFGAEIEQVDLFSWAITERGTLQTVRFDNADDMTIDPARSTGVLGANRHGGALYVALDPAAPRAVVALRTQAEDERQREQGKTQPTLLIESRWQLSSHVRETCGFTVKAQGYGPGDMVWRTTPGKTFTATASRDGTQLYSGAVQSDAQGMLTLRIDADAVSPLSLRLECHD